ncbi:MAG: ABC transporter permease [Streptomycetaceae bacterium]|nr:MAG: ABC transporter permease [Streptomycetaceae bacterium]
MKINETSSNSSTSVGEFDASLLAKFRVRLKDPYFWADWMVVFAFLLVVTIFGAIAPTKFLTMYNLNNILIASAIPAILVIGQTFVVATAGIDLSVSSVMTLGAVTFGLAFTNGWSVLFSCLFGTIVGALCGIVNGIIISKWKINDFIVTLGMLSIASGFALVLSHGSPRQVINESLSKLAIGAVGQLPYLMIIALVLATIAHFALFNTRFGTHVFATGGNEESARSMGISTVRIKIAVYTISGILAGFAATLAVSRIGSAEPAANTALLLNSVAAVVLGGVSLFGGRGTIFGPIMATILLQSLTNGLTVVGVASYYQYISIGSVVIISAMLVRTSK